MNDCNDFSEDLYNKLIAGLQIHMVECTCGKKGCLIFYGHYKRNFKYFSKIISLSIQRVWCKACHKANALIPSLVVPYSQIPLHDQQDIISNVSSGLSPESVLSRNILIDENHVKYILRMFKHHWKQRLLSIGLSVTDCLTVPCLAAFSRQFMQIHRTCNKLCTITNTPLPDHSRDIP